MTSYRHSLRRSSSILTLTAATTAVVGAPVRKWLVQRGRLDIPNHRSSHRDPVPRGGGIAALLGASTTVLVTRTPVRPRLAIAVLGLATLGWLDDVTGHVPVAARLTGQVGAGAFALSRDLLDVPIAAITTTVVVNVFNFMDGINGISGLTAVVWGVNALHVGAKEDSKLATVGALTAGAGLGFLPLNVPSAQLFLGDVGSYAFGGVMAAGILSRPTLITRLQTAAPLLPYAVDTAQALVRRQMKGRPLTEAHRDHVYQILVDAGYSHTQVATLHAIFAALITTSTYMPKRRATIAIPFLTLSYLGTALVANKIMVRQSNESRHDGQLE